MPSKLPPVLLVLLGFGIAGAGSASNPATSVATSSSRFWVRSAGGATTHLSMDRQRPQEASVTEALPLVGREWREVARNFADEVLRMKSEGDLLLVRASADFDITAVDVHAEPPRRLGTVLRATQHVSTPVAWKRGPLPVTLALLTPDSSVELQLMAKGKVAGFVNVSSAQPTSIELDLGSLIDSRTAREPLGVI